jgi:hypothetical protein
VTYHDKARDKHDDMADAILSCLVEREDWPNVQPLLSQALRRHHEGYGMQSSCLLKGELEEFFSWYDPRPDHFRADWRAVCLQS